ncbi:MAG: hypothetical protein AAFS02_11975 [Pseudomonadota bacterium]
MRISLLVLRLQAFCLAAVNKERSSEDHTELSVVFVAASVCILPMFAAVIVIAKVTGWGGPGDVTLPKVLLIAAVVVFCDAVYRFSDRTYTKNRREIDELATELVGSIPRGRSGVRLLLFLYILVVVSIPWVVVELH